MNKLTNTQHIYLRMIEHTGGLKVTSECLNFLDETSDQITTDFNYLVRVGAIKKIGDNYHITEKGQKIIHENEFVVVYPLANEKGVVTNYNDVLTTMSNSASKALGMALLHTDSHKRWNKYTIMTLLEKLIKSQDYFRTFETPKTKILAYQNDIDIATTKLQEQIGIEFSKINSFNLAVPVNINGWELVTINNPGVGLFHKDGKEELKDLVNGDFTLSDEIKIEIINQHYNKTRYGAQKSNTNPDTTDSKLHDKVQVLDK